MDVDDVDDVDVADVDDVDADEHDHTRTHRCCGLPQFPFAPHWNQDSSSIIALGFPVLVMLSVTATRTTTLPAIVCSGCWVTEACFSIWLGVMRNMEDDFDGMCFDSVDFRGWCAKPGNVGKPGLGSGVVQVGAD